MQTRALETLVCIAQVHSFSQAATLLNMTLPALSMQMKALEAELGVTLFDRSFRPPKLTPLGRRIAQQATHVIAQTSALTALCVPTETLIGSFRLGFTQSASVRIMPTFIENAQGRARKATFHYTTALSETLSHQVLNNQLDAAVVTQVDTSGEHLRYDEIASEALALAVPSAFAKTPIGDLGDELTFIHFMPTTGIGRLIATRLESLQRKPRNTLVLDGIEAAVACVKRGIGYTILPLEDIKRYADNNIFIHSGGISPLKRKMALITRQDAKVDLWRPQLLALLI